MAYISESSAKGILLDFDYKLYFDAMENETAGKLIKNIFAAVNDEPLQTLSKETESIQAFILQKVTDNINRYNEKCLRNKQNRQEVNNDRQRPLTTVDNGQQSLITDSNINKGIIKKDKVNKGKVDKENVNSIAQSLNESSELIADVVAIPLNNGMEWKPTQSLFDEYIRLYPAVDVKQQFNAMRSWCLSNPERAKTKRGITRFVNSWLSREQDKGSRTGQLQQQHEKNTSEKYSQEVFDKFLA